MLLTFVMSPGDHRDHPSYAGAAEQKETEARIKEAVRKPEAETQDREAKVRLREEEISRKEEEVGCFEQA